MTNAAGNPKVPQRLLMGWLLVGLSLLALASTLVANRSRFDWSLPLAEIPAIPLMAGLIAAGVVFLAVLPLVRASEDLGRRPRRILLGVVIAIGLATRLLMFGTEPALEDDQQRYLFEGAMVANGVSPYRYSPKDAMMADRDSKLGQLAEASRPVIDRVNHPALKTIYPPIAQAAFALSYELAPFSLTAWRALSISAECAALLMLLRLLSLTGQSPLWVALYWWNPLAVKEIANSGHMEGILLLLVVATAYLSARQRPLWAAVTLSLAIGVKIWPALLAPLIFRPLFGRPRHLCTAIFIVAGLSAVWAVPILLGGLDERSGFLAYAQRWQANGALLPALRDTLRTMVGQLGFPIDGATAGRVARLLLATAAAAIAVLAARAPIRDNNDLLRRFAVVTLAVFLLSPAQFPWYTLWTLPFLVFRPRWSVMAMAVTLPIYYSSFYYSSIDAFDVFRDKIVWLVWIPIWILLAWEQWRAKEQLPHPSSSSRVT